MHEINAILTIAYRDLVKLMRDRARLLITFIFPFLFIGILGNSLQASLGNVAGYDLLLYVFTGVLGQTLFQSTAQGIISLIEDRENDFSQEIFISPVSRYSIIIGKIIGETLVSLVQAVGIILFGLIVGVPLSLSLIIQLIPAMFIACILGGAFGILVLSNLSSQRAANQAFPLIIFPQFFLAGVFNPIQNLPWYLDILSRISPMRYAVDLIRNFYYWNHPDYSHVVLSSLSTNLLIISAVTVICLIIGTALFVNNERNR